MNVRSGNLIKYAGTSVLVGLGASGIAACAGKVLVGDVVEGTDGAIVSGTGGANPTSANCQDCGGAAPALDCTEEDAREREGRERWLATTNSLGELAGSRWETPDGDPFLVLDLQLDQSGTLQVGEPAPPPTRDDGYLDQEADLPPGATFPLQGASFDGSELLVPLALRSPYEAWCRLQPPYVFEEPPCSALLSHRVNCNGATCDVDGLRTVTQYWVTTADLDVCTCTTTECFALIEWPEWEPGQTYADWENYFQAPALRLTYDAETDTLSGGFFPQGLPPGGQHLEFVRAE